MRIAAATQLTPTGCDRKIDIPQAEAKAEPVAETAEQPSQAIQ